MLGSRRCILGPDPSLASAKRDRSSLRDLDGGRGSPGEAPGSPRPLPLVRYRGRTLRVGPKKFAEPVSLSSTASADFRLPATAFGLGFDLLALRARRKWESNVSSKRIKGSKEVVAAICGFFLFQHFHSPSSNVWTRLWKPL